jgi:hypothetical protein
MLADAASSVDPATFPPDIDYRRQQARCRADAGGVLDQVLLHIGRIATVRAR